jgi:Calcium binding
MKRSSTRTGPKNARWDGITTWKTNCTFLFGPDASLQISFHRSARVKPVEVLRMAPEVSCSVDMLVLIRWQGRKLAVPLSQLAAIDVDQSTADAIGDWHYWVAQGYLF